MGGIHYLLSLKYNASFYGNADFIEIESILEQVSIGEMGSKSLLVRYKIFSC